MQLTDSGRFFLARDIVALTCEFEDDSIRNRIRSEDEVFLHGDFFCRYCYSASDIHDFPLEIEKKERKIKIPIDDRNFDIMA